jgi:putative ABC transport system permease protein
VQAAVPVVQVPTAVFDAGGAVPVLALGVETRGPGLARERLARDYELRSGSPLGDEDGALLDAAFAAAHGFGLGHELRMLTPLAAASGPQVVRLRVLGLLEPRSGAAFNGGAVVFLPKATAQRLFALRGRVNCVQLVPAEGADVARVEADVRAHLPAGLAVGEPASRGELAQHSLKSTETGLGAASVISFVAGGFVILNAFLMSLGERRKNLAILRALGATRGQVTRLLVREALTLGVTGTLLGVAAGFGLAVGLRRVMGDILGLTLPPTRWTVEPFLLAALLGPGMALAAIALPARRAGRRAPLPDLLNRRGAPDDVPRRWPAYTGLVLFLAPLALVLGGAYGWFPLIELSWLGPLTGVVMVGAVLAFPLVLLPLLRGVGRVLGPALGPEARLAVRYLARHPVRTTLTAGVLLACMTMCIGFGQSMRNNIRHIYEWVANNIRDDFFVRGLMPDNTLVMTAAPLPEELGGELGRLEGVESVGKVSFLLGRCNGRQVVLLPRTLPVEDRLPFALASGDAAEVRRRFRDGDLVLGTPLARRLGVGVGDEVSLETRQGTRRLRVAGTTAEYTVGGMMAYLDWEKGKEFFDLRGVHVFTLQVRPGSAAAVEPRLRAFCRERDLYCQSNAEFRGLVERAVDSVGAFYWMLVVLGFVVASLGTVNTLTMNVLEQTREIGVLRAVAMTRPQVRKLIVGQALALGVVGLLPGCVVGVVTAWAMNVAGRAMLGQPIPFHLEPGFVAGCVVAGFGITLLAALLPARRAVRLPVIQALQYE